MKTFREKVEAKWKEKKFLCVGLDPDIEKLPLVLKSKPTKETILEFNKAIIDATHDLVCAFKPNIAFYESYEADGWEVLQQTVSYIHEKAPDMPVILDAKRGDIGNTNDSYTKAYFETLKFDAVTLHPYMGKDSLESFFKYKDKGCFILVRTSNPGAGEFQDLKVNDKPLYEIVAEHISKEWNLNKNCGVVVGATYPEELAVIRKIIGDMPILIPGIGSQGGDIEKTVKAGKDSKGQGMIIHTSRAVLYASSGDDFADAARAEAERLHKEILEAL